MVDRRESESLEPELGGPPSLQEVGARQADEMPSVCVAIKRARMMAGHELKDVATVLRIRLLYLEALEDGRFDDLPGMTYAVGFLRSYSEYLGLNPGEMVDRLKRETATGTVQADLDFPIPPKEGGRPKPWLILVVLVLAGLAYGGWRVYSTEGRIATNLVTDVSTTITEAAGLTDGEEAIAASESRTVSDPITENSSVSEPMVSADGTAAEIAVAEEVPSVAVETEFPASATDETAFSANLEPASVSEGSGGVDLEVPAMAIEAVDSTADAGEVAATRDTRPLDDAAPFEDTAVVEDMSAIEDVTVTQDMAALDTPAEAASSLSAGEPQGNESLWDSVVENQPADRIVLVDPSTTGSGETIPIVSNANAQDLNSADGSEPFDIASVSPETIDVSAYVPSVYGTENTDFRIAIIATADSWVQIQGPNNELLLTRILRTGDIYQVPDRTGLIMVTGNAGALELRVDGAVVGALGPIGTVRRNVQLDPEALVAANTASR